MGVSKLEGFKTPHSVQKLSARHSIYTHSYFYIPLFKPWSAPRRCGMAVLAAFTKYWYAVPYA